MKHITLSIGNLALIDKLDTQFQYFLRVFSGIGGRAKNIVPTTKLLIYNRLEECFSINRILQGYDSELFNQLKFESIPSDRSLYRDLVRIGKNYMFILERHQHFLKEECLLTNTQFMDFSSSYHEGKGEALGEYGYSRDNQPGKKQITFGISTGINGIPSALTIQKGNVQDKVHFRFMVKTCEAILEENCLLVFDCGGNTKENKRLVRDRKFHYLTFKPKKAGPYKILIEQFKTGTKENVTINDIGYVCVKIKNNDETVYIFFSDKLKQEQLEAKGRKFEKELKKNKILLNKTKTGKNLGEYITEEGIVLAKGVLQKTLEKSKNYRINGLEGFFILESSLNMTEERALALYKDKDKAEKLFRNIKEGTEIRPIRHWSKEAIIGYILVIFLTNFIVNLTLLRTREPVVKNLKLLKKSLSKLTLVIIQSDSGFKHHLLANFSEDIRTILGNFPEIYGRNTIPLAW